VKAGGAVMISDLEFNSDYVRDVIVPIVSSPAKLSEMTKVTLSLGHKDSAADLAALVLSVAGKVRP
jgi:UDP-N-acetylglucosamine--N-acetylmuramyl-(pentapeptide) pyrophosphoryl-undecaprenol N-acetylglucosamine transferase